VIIEIAAIVAVGLIAFFSGKSYGFDKGVDEQERKTRHELKRYRDKQAEEWEKSWEIYREAQSAHIGRCETIREQFIEHAQTDLDMALKYRKIIKEMERYAPASPNVNQSSVSYY
jgi:hypothetical protein